MDIISGQHGVGNGKRCSAQKRQSTGWENLNKRFKLAAAVYNLSQLMRKLFGFGTPKQLEASRGVLAVFGGLGNDWMDSS